MIIKVCFLTINDLKYFAFVEERTRIKAQNSFTIQGFNLIADLSRSFHLDLPATREGPTLTYIVTSHLTAVCVHTRGSRILVREARIFLWGFADRALRSSMNQVSLCRLGFRALEALGVFHS